MSSIPEEIQEDILLRLPVKSILRFKSVCKSWYTYIRNLKFVNDHLNCSKKNPRIMVRDYFCREGREIFYIADYNSILSAAASSSCKCEAVVRLNCPETKKKGVMNRYYEVLGSCNGLLCVISPYSDDSDTPILWNPSTREYKEITPALEYLESPYYGFGYDSKINDYKLVCIESNYDEGYLEAYVYTLKSGSWRKVMKTIPRVDLGEPVGLLLNGALHWTLANATDEISDAIIAFDIGNEKFTNFPIPEKILGRPTSDNYSHLRVFGDSLCIARSVFKVQVDVWIMKNYGVKESWTKLFTTTRNTITRNPYSLKLFWYFINGDFLIGAAGRFGIYDQKNDRIRFLNIDGLDNSRTFL